MPEEPSILPLWLDPTCDVALMWQDVALISGMEKDLSLDFYLLFRHGYTKCTNIRCLHVTGEPSHNR